MYRHYPREMSGKCVQLMVQDLCQGNHVLPTLIWGSNHTLPIREWKLRILSHCGRRETGVAMVSRLRTVVHVDSGSEDPALSVRVTAMTVSAECKSGTKKQHSSPYCFPQSFLQPNQAQWSQIQINSSQLNGSGQNLEHAYFDILMKATK
ncbi:hypothetical protein BU17DRAFT_69317 [Hysterangium stoloniferum]|nr:hypothetical protein BU17DRAFT_69317 [Hysterangium stoloniferum]